MSNLFSSSIPVCLFSVSGCAEFGISEFEAALAKRNASLKRISHWTAVPATDEPILVIGTVTDRRISILLESAGVDCLIEKEGLICNWCGITGKGQALVLAGADDTGLMYNLLEFARRINVNGLSALSEAADMTEAPLNRIRCVDRYVMGHLDDEWFLSEDFWQYLLGRMAYARFNRFCLIAGFDTAYFTPPYPFFINQKNYPDVKLKSDSKIDIGRNLEALRMIGRLCHEHGLKFTFATWQQRPWTAVQDQMIENLPESEIELSDYCYDGLKELITAVPEIDVVQFRVNHESGVGDKVSAEDFWNRCVDAVADVAEATGRPLIVDLRAKGLTDSMIAHAFSRGLNVEVPTKYWCEHAALPYHMSVMRSEELDQLDNYNHSRRYSYADMLKKPRHYDVIYRLWNYGSTNLFIWGDADYARRFSLSCKMSDSAGFQINTPLSLKYGHELLQKEHWHIFAKPELRSGKWEDERFWMWYTVFGRLGYNPDTCPSVWCDEFVVRFGKERGPVIEHALGVASKIVPLITAAHMPVHPSLRYWTEKNTGYAIFHENNIEALRHFDWQQIVTYGNSEPSDQGLFYAIDRYAKDLCEETLKGKYSPLQVAAWLDDLARSVKSLITKAAGFDSPDSAEYNALLTDLDMLCDIARYHANKMRAALAVELWYIKKEHTLLADAKIYLDTALAYWKTLSARGLENYHHNLEFSSAETMTRRGTWNDLTCEIEADVSTLTELMSKNDIAPVNAVSGLIESSYLSQESRIMFADFPDWAPAGEDLVIDVAVSGLWNAGAAPTLHYRHCDQTSGFYKTTTMEKSAGGFSAVIPAEYLTPEWDIQIYITIQEPDGICTMFPGIYHPIYPHPFHVIDIV